MELDIAAMIEKAEEKIEAACRRSGRKRQEVKLMGVTKFCPLEAVEAAWRAGLRLFGENRVLEGTAKFETFRKIHPWDGGAEVHLIGSLQRNKAKSAAAFFDCVQSVDRDSLLDELGALSAGREQPLKVLLEYHTGEESKSGFSGEDNLYRAAEKLLSFPGLLPAGLMTMAPFTDDDALVRSSFRKLARAGAELKKRFPLSRGSWGCLSMGMSNDFEIAIEEGSTMIRLGTALFGKRSL